MQRFRPGSSFWLGKTVWVIGASKGIGRALVEILGEEGAIIIATARPSKELTGLVDERNAAGNAVYLLPWDVTCAYKGDLTLPLETQFPDGIDVLIYCAGFWEPNQLPSLDVESILWQSDVNYAGMVRAIGLALPDMMSRRSGVIAGLASAAALAPLPNAEGYGASKSAVIYFLQSLRMDLKKYGVRVATVLPGFVDTELTRKNNFRMPFMISANESARSIVEGLKSGLAEIHGPKRLTVPLKLIGWLPRGIKEALLARLFAR